MILACHNITKAFGDQIIVKNGSFHIEDREKAALVGINGAGKTTLLKIIILPTRAISSLQRENLSVIFPSTRKWKAATAF